MEISPLIGDLAIGTLSGYSIGYAARKFFRVLSIIVGAYLASLIYFSKRNFISVNWSELNSSAEGLLTGIGNMSLGVSVLGMGAVTGFALGWRSG